MDTRIDTLLTQVSEIEETLSLLQQHNDNVMATLKAKLDSLKQQIKDIEKEYNSSKISTEPVTTVPPEPVIKPEPKPEPMPEPDPKPEPESKPEPKPVVVPPAYVKPKVSRDIMSTFSINDRFLFLRELFDGNEQRFNDAISEIEKMRDINQVSDYVTQNLLFDPSREEVKEFLMLIGLNF